MNLKDQKNQKLFDFKTIVENLKNKTNRIGRKTPFKPITPGNLNSRLVQKKNKNLTKAQVYLRRLAIFFTLFFLFISLFGILVLLGVVSAMSRDLPNVDKYLEDSKKLGTETIIYDRSGVELYRLRGRVVNERVAIKDVPDKMQWAFLAAEDANFKTHKGLDLFGLSRALSCTIGNYLSKKSYESCGGGSSITQQLIKVTTAEDERSLERKIREAILAMRVEETYSKDEILESYLNIVGQGREYVGIRTGSIYIFGKSDLNELTLAETCYIAAFPNNPEIFSPRGAIYNPERSKERAIYVLDRMYELRDKTGITKEEYDQALADIPNVKFANDRINIKAGHFVNEVLNEIDLLYSDKVTEGQKGRDYLRTQGYKVYTTVDYPKQEMLERVIKERVESKEFQDKTGAQTASAVIEDVKTGEVLALVGSRDFNGPEGDVRFAPKFNAAAAYRSVGSSIKPFVYGSTFEKGYNPSSIVADIPIDQSPSAAFRPGRPYPYNFVVGQFSFYGAGRGSTTGRGDFITMRQGLRWSLNQPAVTAANIAGVEQYADFYVRLTGNENLRAEFKGPSAALGSANVPLMDHVHAFTTLADNGVYKPRKLLLRIEDEKGNLVYDNSKVESKQVIEKSVAYLVNDMNKNYFIFETDIDSRIGPNTANLIRDIRKNTDWAGKTGTSDTDRGPGDIVFVGYTPDTVIGMWAGNSCGYNDPACTPLKPSAESGWLYDYVYSFALNEYKQYFKPGRFQQPEGVRRVAVCSLTGNAYSDNCAKAGGNAIQELVSDKSLPKAETWIESQSVTQCGDRLKLARDIDKDLGLATTRYVVRYDKIFPQKYIADQVLKYLTAKGTTPIITETCDVARSLRPPEVAINTPQSGATFSQSDTLNLSATITSDIPLQKVEIVKSDGVIIKTFGPSEPVNLAIALNTYSPGTNTIKVVATNTKGNEGIANINFTVIAVGAAVLFQSPAPNAQIKKTTFQPITVRVSGVTAANVTSVTYTVTGSNGYTSGPINATGSGNNWTGAWTLPEPSNTITYSISVNAITTTNGTLNSQIGGIKIIP